jgi:hypothetical protein
LVIKQSWIPARQNDMNAVMNNKTTKLDLISFEKFAFMAKIF